MLHVLSKMLAGIDLHKDGVSSSNWSRRITNMRDAADINLPPLHSNDLGIKLQHRPERNRQRKVHLKVNSHAAHPDLQRSSAKHLVERGGKQATVNHAGPALHPRLDRHLRADGDALTGDHLDMQTNGSIVAATKAHGMVQADRLTWLDSPRMADGNLNVRRNLELVLHVI